MYNTYKAAIREMVVSLLGSTSLNYVGRIYCVHGDIVGTSKESKYLEMAELAR